MLSTLISKITNFFLNYYVNLQNEPLFYSLPLLFLICILYVAYVAITTLIDDHNWPPRKRNLRHPQDIVKIEGKYPYRRLVFQYQSVYQSLQSTKDYFVNISKRRSLRSFSSLSVNKQVVENILRSAYSAPSYLNTKPFNFIAIFNREKLKQISTLFINNQNNNNNNNHNHNNHNNNKNKPNDNNENNDYDINKKLDIEETSEIIRRAPVVVVFTKVLPENADLDEIEMEEVEKSLGISMGFFLCAIHNAGLYGVVLSLKSEEIKEELKGALDVKENHSIYSIVAIGYPEVGVDVPAFPNYPLSSYANFFD